MAGDSVETLSDQEIEGACCLKLRHINMVRAARLAGAFYDRFLWVSDDQEDLYRAALFKGKSEGVHVPTFIMDMDMYLKYMKKYHPKTLKGLVEQYFPKAF